VAELIIFYDGGCPLCVSEMRHLSKLDTAGKIALENIHADDFTVRFPHIDQQRADQILHGQLASGEVIYALDVTYNAWALVGKRHWVAILRWPLIKQVADYSYLFFAKYRSTISKLLTGSELCEMCSITRDQSSCK
jgi:predicted DCC family thiol-disulfide oxidoreductase YuxK